MKISELDGYQELEADLLSLQRKLFAELPADFRQKVLADLPTSERLAGLPPSELPADFRQKVLAGLPASERLAGLPASERLAGLPASERLAGLSAEELAELRVLLTR